MPQQPPAVGGRLLGVLSHGPGSKKLEGKSFYLDAVKSRPAAILVEAISHLGGTIESFLNKDVSFVVTGSLEELRSMRSEGTRGGSDGLSGECSTSPPSTKPRQNIMTSSRLQRPVTGTPRPQVCGSRGMALLEKAIRNNERLKGNSVLANARSWGVKIVNVDDLLAYVQRLTAEVSKAKRRKSEVKNAPKYPAVSRVIKTAALKSPYLKVEDSSRKYKPLHMQSMAFPSLCYSGRFSPFEPPAPPQPKGSKEPGQNRTRLIIKSSSANQDKAECHLLRTTSRCHARKKNLGYCECCYEPFKDQDEHLLSAQHRGFVQDPSNYSVVDQLVAGMEPGFAPCPPSETAAAAQLRLDPPLLELTPSPSEMQTHSEVELAIQALLTQGSPSTSLEQSPPRPAYDLAPVLSQSLTFSCTDNEPSSPKTPCRSPSPACQTSHAQPPFPCLDTLCQTRCQPLGSNFAPVPSQSLTVSSCPDALDRPPSPYADPPVLSPQNVLLFELSSQPDGPYSDPPVLSPQVPQKDGDGMEIAPASDEVAPVPLSFCTPPRLSSGIDLGGALAEWNPETFILMNDRPTDPKPGRSHSLPLLWSREQNQRKRRRSESPGPKACKRKWTPSTTGGHKSEPICSFSRADWTRRERQPGVSVTYTGLAAAGQAPTRAPESSENVGHDAGVPADSVPVFTLGRGLCPSLKVANVTSWPLLRYLGASQSVVDYCSRNFPAETPLDYKQRSLCVGEDVLPTHCPATPSLAASFPSPSNKATQRPRSSQDSKPPEAFPTPCVDSALLPDLDTLSPSDSDSDWECDLMARLGPRTDARPMVSLLPRPAGCQPQRLDMELLQRPCSRGTLHNTSYELRLSSVLRQPPTPPSEPSSAFSERVPAHQRVTPH